MGEPQLAGDLESDATRLFAELKASGPGKWHDLQFDALRERIDDLIATNRAAMFRANGNAVILSRRVAIEFAAVLVALVLVGIGGSWVLGSLMSKPLTEFAQRLMAVSHRRTNVRVQHPNIAELDQVARAFNYMAEQLDGSKSLMSSG